MLTYCRYSRRRMKINGGLITHAHKLENKSKNYVVRPYRPTSTEEKDLTVLLLSRLQRRLQDEDELYTHSSNRSRLQNELS